MDLLLITKDTNVLREGSEIRAALLEQAKLLNHLFVIVLNSRERFDIQRVSETVLFVPVNAWTWWLAPFDALEVAHREFFFQRHFQADLVSAYDPCESGLAALLISRRYEKPLHLHIEQNVFSRQFKRARVFTNSIRAYVARFVVHAASAIHVTSEDIKTSIAEVVPDSAERTAVFPHFIDVESFQNEPVRVDLRAKYPQFKFIILAVISSESSDHIDRALEVLAGVLKQYAYAGLVITGDGVSDRIVQARTKNLGISAHVAVEENIDDLVSYFKTAHVFLMTDSREGNNNVVAKAVACGCPIVCTSVGIAKLIVTNGESGFLCESDDTGCFVGNIMKLLSNAPIRFRIQHNSSALLQDAVGGTKEGYQQWVKDSWESAIKNAGVGILKV